MFRVTVKKVTPKEPTADGYSREDSRDLYEQEFETLDVPALARFLNAEPPPNYPGQGLAGRMVPLDAKP